LTKFEYISSIAFRVEESIINLLFNNNGKVNMFLSAVDRESTSANKNEEPVQQQYIVLTGEVVYEALLESCWDEANENPRIAAVTCTAVLLKLEMYLQRLQLPKTDWTAIQLSLTAYLRSKNISITDPMRKRLYIILDHFCKKQES
jgi:hypothetical protein